MFYVLIAPPDEDEVIDIPANRGYDADLVRGHLARLAADGHTVVDEPLSEEQRRNAYFDASNQARLLHVEVSRVFGSRRRSGVDWFGKVVPALLVYESEGGKIVGIYPHSHKHDPVDTTIVDYLESVSPTPVSWVATRMPEAR
jgi:hypothetical protein